MVTTGCYYSFVSVLLSDDIVYGLNIIDTPGVERLRPLAGAYLIRSDIIIIMYDITNKDSFNEVSYFNQQIKEICKMNKKVILLGNRVVLDKEREVSFEEGKSLAKSNNFVFMEVSCVKNENIKKAMEIAISIGLKDLNKESTKSFQESKEIRLRVSTKSFQESNEILSRASCLII